MQSIDRLGKYTVVREIGRGAMGVVYEGFDPAIERTVALKVLHFDPANEAAIDEARLRFKREVQSAGRLNHPNIITVYDYGEAGDSAQSGLDAPFIAMEFVQGKDLKQLLQANRRFSTAEISRLMQQLLAALQHAHDHGVVHRDVKPSNVILCSDEVVKLADFGIARIDRSELTVSGTVLGSAAYMAPEQLTGMGVDHRADVYAAGALLYELLTGEPPFLGSTTSVIQKILNQAALPPSIVNPLCPRSLDTVLGKALAKRPEERFASAQSFSRAIAAAVEGPDADATLMRRDTVGRAATPGARQRPSSVRRVAWAGLAGSAAVAAGVFLLWPSPHTPTEAPPALPPQVALPASATEPPSSGLAVAETAALRPARSLAAPDQEPSRAASARPAPPPPALKKPGSGRPAVPAEHPLVAQMASASAADATRRRTPAASASAPPPPPAPPPASGSRVANPQIPSSSDDQGAIERMIAACPAKAGQDGKDCRLRIASFYREGRIVRQDHAAALRWYRSGADLGDAEAQYQLARLYFLGRGTAENYGEGIPWLKRAADQGNAGAETLLGYAHERGLGLAIDRQAAVNWYRKAADQGYPPGQNNLGRAYLYGIGVAKDPAKAAALLRSASDSGDANAAFNLGSMFEKGIGVAPSNEQAAAWYRTAFSRPGLNLWSVQERDHAKALIASQAASAR